jgi:hypothetical protein
VPTLLARHEELVQRINALEQAQAYLGRGTS